MIIHNEFSRFNYIAEKIDKELYYLNLIIKKGKPARNENGIIYIDETDNPIYFGSELVHEGGHSVFDPINPLNYINSIYAIVKKLNIAQEEAIKYANIASDIINSYKTLRNKVLSDFRKQGIELLYNQYYNISDPIRKELYGIFGKMFNCNYKAESKLYSKVINVLNQNLNREATYVKIAELFRDFQNQNKQNQNQNQNQNNNQNDNIGNNPFNINKEEAKKILRKIFQNNKEAEEVIRKTQILLKLIGSKEDKEDLKRELYNSTEFLKQFYQAKADKIKLTIEFPKEDCYKGIKLGSQKWNVSDNPKLIDVKKTVIKYGINIPLITTQKPRIFNQFIGSFENKKPIDLVISIDISGSVGSPSLHLDSVIDFEIIMLYAIIDLAKRLDQNIGLTLWDNDIYFTTLPKTYSWRESEKLKEEVLIRISGGGTNIICALEQARYYKDKLFFIFTDGEVDLGDLIKVDNVIFFLIQPGRFRVDYFKKKYGSERVIVINKLEDIPKITLKTYLKVFRK